MMVRKSIKAVNVICLVVSIQMLAMNNSEFKFLNILENSALQRKCMLCKKGFIKKECKFLDQKLENVDTTGGRRSSPGSSVWSFIVDLGAEMAQKAAGERNRQAIDTILADESSDIRDQEERKYTELAYKLMENYDKREALKKERKLQILKQLELEQQQWETSKDESGIVQDTNENYPLMGGMLSSSKVKPVCLGLKRARFMRGSLERCCDNIEEDFKKIAEDGCIEFGFLHSTTFADKKDNHKRVLDTILAHESEDSKEEEWIKLEFYASQLKNNYIKQQKLQDDLRSQIRWQKYQEQQKNKNKS